MRSNAQGPKRHHQILLFQSVARIIGLNVAARGLSGPIPSILSNLRWVTTLSMDSNDFTGPIPESFRTMTTLKFMSLFYTSLSGSLPSWLGELTEMENFNVDWTQVSGLVPDSIRRWSKLQKIWLSNTELSGDVGSIFTSSNHRGLETLALSGTYISGRLDPSLETTPNLFLHDNCMTFSDSVIARQEPGKVQVLPPRTTGCRVTAPPPNPTSPPSSTSSLISETQRITDVSTSLTTSIGQDFNSSTSTFSNRNSAAIATTSSFLPSTDIQTQTPAAQNPQTDSQTQQNFLLPLMVGVLTFCIIIVMLGSIFLYWKRSKSKTESDRTASIETPNATTPSSRRPARRDIEQPAPAYSEVVSRNPATTPSTSLTPGSTKLCDQPLFPANLTDVPPKQLAAAEIDHDDSLLFLPKEDEGLGRATLILDLGSEAGEVISGDAKKLKESDMDTKYDDSLLYLPKEEEELGRARLILDLGVRMGMYLVKMRRNRNRDGICR
ncbi:hypothetical protein BC829DRAFT_75937 [Chytridium lagenaria]|nr:hypothetical protein BC829DRAFT_75937 [Chytridium lagenaria]